MAAALRHVHFVGIGGTGMGALAGLVAGRGVRVTGSDRGRLYPPMSDALARWKIPVHEGFRAEQALAGPPDLVVIGNAIRRDNPEAQAAFDAQLRVLSFSDAVWELALRERHPVVVSGTHGKTTTTALVGTVLAETGRDPGVLLGGIAANFDGSFRDGAGPHFVVEGDEYDTAFFDKTAKFLHYHPRTLVLTSVEFDHADIYDDLEHVKGVFRELLEGMPADGCVVAALDHAGVRDVVRAAPCRVVGYGVGDDGPGEAALRARELRPDADGTGFVVAGEGADGVPARVALHGRHNVENALAALLTARELGVPLPDAVAALGRFGGVRRRQELRGRAGGVDVVDDFAHHPTAVRETVAAARARWPERRLVAVFEPRSNTSRRAVFQQDYAGAFDGADRVVVCEVDDAPIYSATGDVSERLSAARLAADLRDRGLDASAAPDPDAIVELLLAEHRAGDVVLVMSNGAFGNLCERLLERLREAS